MISKLPVQSVLYVLLGRAPSRNTPYPAVYPSVDQASLIALSPYDFPTFMAGLASVIDR